MSWVLISKSAFSTQLSSADVNSLCSLQTVGCCRDPSCGLYGNLALTLDESVSCCLGADQTKYLLETDEKRILLLIAFPLSTMAGVFKVVKGRYLPIRRQHQSGLTNQRTVLFNLCVLTAINSQRYQQASSVVLSYL